MDAASRRAVPGGRLSSAVADAPPPALPPAPGFRHEYVDTPGLRTHVAIAGEGEPVVMLHGFPEHWWQWRVIGAGLARQYRVICPDLRGAGWTRAASPRIASQAPRDDLLALMDALGLDRVRLVAHDRGALSAAPAAYAAPERVRAMVILAVPPPFMPISLGMLPAMRHVPRFLFHRRGTSIADIFAPPYVVTPMETEEIEAYLAPQRDPEIDAATAEIYRWIVRAETPRLLGGAYRRMRLRVPTLYALGAEDRPLTPDFVRKHSGDTTRFADHVEIAEVPSAAHFSTDDNPDAVEHLIRDFFLRENALRADPAGSR